MDLILETALAMADAGFAMHWLRAGEKIPVKSGWATAPAPTIDELRDTYRQGFNVGFRPGSYSVVDGQEVCVLDVDIRGGERFVDEAYAAANSIMEWEFKPTVVSGSGIGRHQYLLFPVGEAPIKAATVLRESDVWILEGRIVQSGREGARPAWQVELLSTGKQVVVPPSIHPDTGNPYAWAGGQNPWA
jgi:hypothetical protein